MSNYREIRKLIRHYEDVVIFCNKGGVKCDDVTYKLHCLYFMLGLI